MNLYIPTLEIDTPKLSDFDHLLITDRTVLQEHLPVTYIAGAVFASQSEISALSAPPKAFKTSMTSVLVSLALSQSGTVDGFEDIYSAPNPDGQAVIVFNTEESKHDSQYQVKMIVKRLGLVATPNNLLFYSLRSTGYKLYKDIVSKICELAVNEFGKIRMLVFDGGADFIGSVNDETQAKEIVEYFTQLATQYNCAVIITVHQNPGGEKERGHFGSEVQRKCYGLITLQRDGDIVTVQPKFLRKSGNADVPPVHLMYSKEGGYIVQVDEPEKRNQKSIREQSRYRDLAAKVFEGCLQLSYTEILSKVMSVTGRKVTASKTEIANLSGFGYIVKKLDGKYEFIDDIDKVKKAGLGSDDLL